MAKKSVEQERETIIKSMRKHELLLWLLDNYPHPTQFTSTTLARFTGDSDMRNASQLPAEFVAAKFFETVSPGTYRLFQDAADITHEIERRLA